MKNLKQNQNQNPKLTLAKKVKNAFSTKLGRQCTSLFTCVDWEIFIRIEEALQYIETNNLERVVLEWFKDDENPQGVSSIQVV